MTEFSYRSEIAAEVAQVFDWHERPGAFHRLSPPWEKVKVLSSTGSIRDGARVILELRKGPIPLRWELVHRDYEPNRRFADEQVSGPFRRWRHEHLFSSAGTGRCLLEDRIRYELPLGLGWWMSPRKMHQDLDRLFAFRHRVTAEDLKRHRHFADLGPRRIAITGSSGLIGGQLTAFLQGGGHEVLPMVRGAGPRASGQIRWEPDRGRIDAEAMEGLDGVVHLAGKSIASGRWTAARKDEIRASRVESTRLLCETLAGLQRKPRVLVCASAVGFYGDRGSTWVDEAGEAGQGFLAEVCQEWEAAAESARLAGIRVVHARLGVVLSGHGGALASMLPAFRFGAGGAVGGGEQYMSWISIEDVLGALHFALFSDDLAGPVNLVAPQPATNAEFTRVLGRVLHRPTILPVPGLAVRTALGEMGEALLLGSVRAAPGKLQSVNFPFLYPSLETALARELGHLPASGGA